MEEKNYYFTLKKERVLELGFKFIRKLLMHKYEYLTTISNNQTNENSLNVQQ